MKLHFSEFSYSHAFVENLLHYYDDAEPGEPIFLNLDNVRHLRQALKMDAPALPLCFQFKLPTMVKSEDSKEVKQYELPLTSPFFRVPIMPRKVARQHDLLVELEENLIGDDEDDHRCVFYAAPVFKSLQKFYTVYGGGRVHRKSALFSPKEIGLLPDGKKHHIAYSIGIDCGWFFDGPVEVHKYTFDDVYQQLGDALEARADVSLAKSIQRITEAAEPLMHEAVQDAEKDIRRRAVSDLAGSSSDDDQESSAEADEAVDLLVEELLMLRNLFRIGLGCELVLAQPK